MTQRTFYFECSRFTYLDCVETSLFSSTRLWPLEIKAGDYVCWITLSIGGLLGVWQATCNGGKNPVPMSGAASLFRK